MAVSTLGRDYDIARILADHERRIAFLERRQLILAGQLSPFRVVQTSNQSVSSSTTLVDTGIVVNLDGLMKIDLEVRWTSGGGGIRWDWDADGAVTMHSRFIGAAPQNGSGGNPQTMPEVQWRASTNLTTDTTVAQFSTSTVQRGSERLIVEGSGTLTFRFAQETSNASATQIFGDFSYAIAQRLAS